MAMVEAQKTEQLEQQISRLSDRINNEVEKINLKLNFLIDILRKGKVGETKELIALASDVPDISTFVDWFLEKLE
uniref:Uncharacterized protein n=1 Tax=viral metagenome TaxID=1070528 RepID=A0A6H2A440_9ZZZZ